MGATMAQKIDYIHSVCIIAQGGVLGLAERYGAFKGTVLRYYALNLFGSLRKIFLHIIV